MVRSIGAQRRFWRGIRRLHRRASMNPAVPVPGSTPYEPSERHTNMGKKSVPDVAQPLFEGLQLKDVAEIDLQVVGLSVWLFMKRRDNSIVRVWISQQDRSDKPLRVTVEVEDA